MRQKTREFYSTDMRYVCLGETSLKLYEGAFLVEEIARRVDVGYGILARSGRTEELLGCARYSVSPGKVRMILSGLVVGTSVSLIRLYSQSSLYHELCGYTATCNGGR